jgi:peptidoglycan-N-acetylglucosamine deacetylase
VTTRPYYRPPFGRHNRTIDDLAGGLGYTRTMMWNGSFSDSEVVTTQILLAQAAKYLRPGVINLGHANHPPCSAASTNWSRSSTAATSARHAG